MMFLPVSMVDYTKVIPIDFLPTEAEFNAFLLGNGETVARMKATVTKWFEQAEVSKMEDKAMAFAPYSILYGVLDTKGNINQVEAFEHMQVIMSDIVVKEDLLRIHLIMFCLNHWFTEVSLNNYLER